MPWAHCLALWRCLGLLAVALSATVPSAAAVGAAAVQPAIPTNVSSPAELLAALQDPSVTNILLEGAMMDRVVGRLHGSSARAGIVRLPAWLQLQGLLRAASNPTALTHECTAFLSSAGTVQLGDLSNATLPIRFESRRLTIAGPGKHPYASGSGHAGRGDTERKAGVIFMQNARPTLRAGTAGRNECRDGQLGSRWWALSCTLPPRPPTSQPPSPSTAASPRRGPLRGPSWISRASGRCSCWATMPALRCRTCLCRACRPSPPPQAHHTRGARHRCCPPGSCSGAGRWRCTPLSSWKTNPRRAPLADCAPEPRPCSPPPSQPTGAPPPGAAHSQAAPCVRREGQGTS